MERDLSERRGVVSREMLRMTCRVMSCTRRLSNPIPVPVPILIPRHTQIELILYT
jgi:hypothetical protein